MAVVISIANFKGGVGKTTSTLNIGAGLSILGKKVLLIDLDPQFNLTQSMGIEEPETSIYYALKGEEELQPIEMQERLYLITSSIDLIRSEMELSGVYQREKVLDKLLQPIKDDYDYILLDCPPSLGVLTFNAFTASDLIYIPIEAEFLALKGYSILKNTLESVGLEIDQVFITKFDRRKVLNRSVLETIQNTLKDKAFKTVIRENITLAETPAVGMDVFSYDANSAGAEDYLSLCKEIIKNTKQ